MSMGVSGKGIRGVVDHFWVITSCSSYGPFPFFLLSFFSSRVSELGVRRVKDYSGRYGGEAGASDSQPSERAKVMRGRPGRPKRPSKGGMCFVIICHGTGKKARANREQRI